MSTAAKKWVVVIAVAALVSSIMMIAGCSSQGSSSSSVSASVSMANPWHKAASAEEAAKGAGLESFPLPTGAIDDLGEPFEVTYSYMDGMAEARYEFAASAVTVRIAKIDAGGSPDVSGDYNTYANEWTENIDGMTVTCAGNRQGESTKTYWSDKGIAYSLVAEGLGGDSDFGLTTGRLTVFVKAMG